MADAPPREAADTPGRETADTGAEKTANASPYAGLFTRGLAILLDFGLISLGVIVLAAIITGLFALLGVFQTVDVRHILASGVVWLSIWGIYLTSFWALTAQTPGMSWMRIAVERPDGARVGWGKASVRAVGTGLAVLPFFLGFLPILFTRRRQALNDILAGTVVVYRTEERDAGIAASRHVASHGSRSSG